MGSLADSLRRSLSGTPAACTCPQDVAESLRRTIGGSDDLCRIHDAAQIEKRRLDEVLVIERERHETLRRIVADQNAADAPNANAHIPIGDDAALLGLLSAHGIVHITEL